MSVQRAKAATVAKQRRSLGARILARTLADRKVLVRKLVVGEAIGDRPMRTLAVGPPTESPVASEDQPPSEVRGKDDAE